MTRVLKLLSTTCIALGILLVLSPVVEEVYTGLTAGETQTAALAAWEFQGGAKPSAPRPAALPAGLVLTVPRLGLRRFVPEGATPAHLRSYGLGRISWTALPGHAGILGIAGHRTTYGAPFFRLHQLRVGDVIRVEYGARRYTYRVTKRETVRPEQGDVLQQDEGPEIALITCAPVYSAAFRLVVFGTLEDVAMRVRR